MPKKVESTTAFALDTISLEEAAQLIGWNKKTLGNYIYSQAQELTPWSWQKGVMYFQVYERGNIVFNKQVLAKWLVARSLNDPTIYLREVERFRNSLN